METEVLCDEARSSTWSLGGHDTDDGTKSSYPLDVSDRHQCARGNSGESTSYTRSEPRHSRVTLIHPGPDETNSRVPAQDEFRVDSDQNREKTGSQPKSAHIVLR